MDRVAVSDRHTGWDPLRGSWEEAVLSWNEQVEATFRRKRADSSRRTWDRRSELSGTRVTTPTSL